VPEGWTTIKDGRRDSKDVYASYPAQDLFAAVLSEDVAVLNQFNLDDNAKQYRWLIQQEMDKFEGETRTGLTTLNGNNAVQYEMRGVVNGVQVVYLHTTVKGTNDYYQVVGWTTADSYRQNKETLQAVINSFRGT
jgi:hypothetical protein